MFNKEIIEAIKARTSISEVVSQKVKLRRSGKSLVGLCPFHNEKTPSFSVSENEGFYYCFGCGAKGDVINFVCETQGVGFNDAVQDLAQKCGVEISPKQAQEAKMMSFYVQLNTKIAQFFEEQLKVEKRATQYLKQRNIDEVTRKEFQIGFAPERYSFSAIAKDSDRDLKALGLVRLSETGNREYNFFRSRVIIPIHNPQGGIIAFGARAILDDQKPKYINSSDSVIFKKQETLFNFHRARKASSSQPVLLVEGYLDVITLYKNGFKAAIAPLGTAVSEHHIKSLWKLSSTPYICLDSDLAGQNAQLRVAKIALEHIQVDKFLKFINTKSLQAKDIDELLNSSNVGKKTFLEAIKNAQHLHEYIWHSYSSACNMADPNERASLEKTLTDLANSMQDKTLSRSYYNYFKQQIWQSYKLTNSTKLHDSTHRKVAQTIHDPQLLKEAQCVHFIIYNPSVVRQEELMESYPIDIQNDELNALLESVLGLTADEESDKYNDEVEAVIGGNVSNHELKAFLFGMQKLKCQPKDLNITYLKYWLELKNIILSQEISQAAQSEDFNKMKALIAERELMNKRISLICMEQE